MSGNQNQIGRRPSHGYIWMNTGDWTGGSIALNTSTFVELTSLGTNFTLAPASQDFVMTTDGQLKYVGAPKKRFTINATVCFSVDSYMVLYKNGVALTESETAFGIYPRIPSFIADLVTDDYLSIYAKCTSNSTVTIYQVSLSAISTDRAV